MKRFDHVVQVRMTKDEREALERLSAMHQCSIEDLIRLELRLEYVAEVHTRTRSHLTLIGGAERPARAARVRSRPVSPSDPARSDSA